MRGDARRGRRDLDATVLPRVNRAFTGIAESTGTLSAGMEIRRLEARGTPSWQAPSSRAPLRVDMRPLFNPSESYTAYVVPAVYLLILHQTLLMGIGLLQGTERERSLHARRARAPGPGRERVAAAAGRTVRTWRSMPPRRDVFRVLLPWLGLPATRRPSRRSRGSSRRSSLAIIWLGVPLGAVFRTRESAMATSSAPRRRWSSRSG